MRKPKDLDKYHSVEDIASRLRQLADQLVAKADPHTRIKANVRLSFYYEAPDAKA